MNRPAPFGFPSGKTICLLLPSLLLALAFPAWASLGDNVTTVQNDKVRMKGTLRSVASQLYVKHEIQVSHRTGCARICFSRWHRLRRSVGGTVSTRSATAFGFLLRAGEASRGGTAASWAWPDIRGDIRFCLSARWTRTQLSWPGLCAVHGATGCRCHRYPIKERACEF